MLTDETEHVFPHRPHISTGKKNSIVQTHFKFHDYVFVNQIDQFLETVAKKKKGARCQTFFGTLSRVEVLETASSSTYNRK